MSTSISSDLGGSTLGFLTKNGQFYGRCDSRKRVYFALLFVSREFAVFVWRRGKKAFTEGHSRQRFDPEDAEL
jgi:hypothetical protein